MTPRAVFLPYTVMIGLLVVLVSAHGFAILAYPSFSIMSPVNLILMAFETMVALASVVGATLATFKRARRAGFAWMLLTLGVASMLVSVLLALSIVSPAAQIHPPTLVDMALLPAHIFFMAGIALLMGRTNSRGESLRISFEVAVVAIGTLLLYGEFVFPELIHGQSLIGGSDAFWSMLYPALDLVIVWLAVALLMRFTRPPRQLVSMAIAAILLAIGISLFNLPSVRGQVIGSAASAGSTAFLVLSLGAVMACGISQMHSPFLVGMGREDIASWSQRAAAYSALWSRIRIIAPHLWIGVAYVLLVREQTEAHAHPELFGLSHIQIGSVAMIGLILIRQMLALRDSERFSSQRGKLLRLSELLTDKNPAATLPAQLLDELLQLVSYDESAIVLRGEQAAPSAVRRRADQPTQETLVIAPPTEWLHALLDQPGATPLIANWSAGDISREDVLRVQMLLLSGAHPLRSVVMIRLMSHDRPIGLLIAGHRQPGAFAVDQIMLLSAFARQAASMIDNAQMRSKERHAAAVNERSRLARDLHDSVSQAVFGALLGIKVARETLSSAPEQARGALEYSESLADAALVEMRALIYELRPETLQREGLVGALQKQVAALCKRHNIDASLHASCGEPVLPIENKEALYRITLEAVQNTVRHAQARKVDVTIACEQGELVLTVRDDGKGFDTTARHDGHYGLSTMQERADQLGARITITSAPNHGALVTVRMPLGVLPSDALQAIVDPGRKPAPAMPHPQG
jgi:signal transduction histidine kinase